MMKLMFIIKDFHVNFIVILFVGILEKEKAYFVELPFEDPSLSMIIYLPIDDTPSAVNDVLQRFSDETINRALTEGSIHEVELEMPKMTFGGEYMLSNVSFGQFSEVDKKKTHFKSHLSLFLLLPFVST